MSSIQQLFQDQLPPLLTPKSLVEKIKELSDGAVVFSMNEIRSLIKKGTLKADLKGGRNYIFSKDDFIKAWTVEYANNLNDAAAGNDADIIIDDSVTKIFNRS